MKIVTLIICLFSFTIIAFQNCSSANFSGVEFKKIEGTFGQGPDSSEDEPVNNPPDENPSDEEVVENPPMDEDCPVEEEEPGIFVSKKKNCKQAERPEVPEDEQPQIPENDEDEDVLACGNMDKEKLMDAVIKIDSIEIIGHDHSSTFVTMDEFSLNGELVDIDIADIASVRVHVKDGEHYFLDSDGNKIIMNIMLINKGIKQHLDISAMSSGPGSIIKFDWKPRIHPGKNKCGLLPVNS